eukprot:m.213962 g.213962  ORF g.213962 m.213962 type:complete len:58 (+) comp17183_c0_seq3:3562-3735(+)
MLDIFHMANELDFGRNGTSVQATYHSSQPQDRSYFHDMEWCYQNRPFAIRQEDTSRG